MQKGNQRKGSANSKGESKIDYEQCAAGDDTHDGESQYKLHTLLQPCDQKSRFATGLSIHTLQLALDEDPTAACKLIRTGGSDLFPLHLVFQNFEALLKRGLCEEELLSFCMQLIWINPSALLLKDTMLEGKFEFVIPFAIFRPIFCWINDSYPDEALPNSKYQRHRKNQQQVTSSSSEERLHLRLSLLFESISHGNHNHVLIDECFPRASLQLCDDVEFILKFLSAIIDSDFSEEQLQRYEVTDLSVDEVLDMVVLGIVSIPCLLKTLLFCKGCEENIFALPVVKHLVLESKGSWLQPLMRSYPEKTIIYFRIVSKFLDDDVGGLIDGEYLKPKNGSSQIADGVLLLQANRDKLVEFLWSQDEIFSVMSDVPEPLLIELVQTRCAERMVDSDAKKYFTTSLLFFDMVYHAIFPMSFHSAAVFLLVHHNVHMFILFSRLTLACLMYFMAREVLYIVSTFGSKRRFIYCVLSPWNWIDWCTVASAVYTNRQLTNDVLNIDAENFVVRQRLIDLLIISTLFIMVQFLSFIRTSNEELAVFVYSVIQTVKDMRWFMLVLVVVLGSFAQMFVFLDIDRDSCWANEGRCEFDASHQLKVLYQMMLGNWDDDNFSSSRGYLIFVMFTFFVGLILLNILIAIASTSYETAKSVGPGIFRMERIRFCAEVTSVERLLLKRGDRRWLIAVALILPVTASIAYFDFYKVHKNSPHDGNEEEYRLKYIISTVVIIFFTVLTFGTLTYASVQERQLVSKYELRLKGGWVFQASTYIFYIIALYGGRFARWIVGTVEKTEDNEDDSFSPNKSAEEEIRDIRLQHVLLLEALKSIDEKMFEKC